MRARSSFNGDPYAFLRTLFGDAVAAVQAERCVPRYLPPPPAGRTVVVGAGKASAAMAASVERHWRGSLSGVVAVPDGYQVPTAQIEVIVAGHPLPDDHSVAAARRVVDAVSGLTADDLVLCLISGGGSALLAAPAAGISLADKQDVVGRLLASGADIVETNVVRKHLSAIKGGRLGAAAAPAQLRTLLISDVPGDDVASIASGPTVADPSTAADANAILERYGIEAPPAVHRHLAAGADESPKPGAAPLARSAATIVASAQDALVAAAGRAEQLGVNAVVLGDAVQGEAREVAKVLAGIAKSVRRHATPAPAPCVLLSGGETTVTVRGRGRGGRNVEFMLALSMALGGEPGVFALAADTDGVDGNAACAGALAGQDTLERAAQSGLDAVACLADNDAYRFFAALGDLVVTGPTFTNVNDFRAVLIA